MADKLNVYKGSELVASAERGAEGTATVSIEGLEANTDYPVGTYKVAFENENGESDKTDVPAFKTKEIRVASVTVAPETIELNVGDTANVTATVAPSTATYKAVSYASSNTDVVTVDDNGQVTAVASGTANITVESMADGSKTATSTVTVAEQTPEQPENVDVTPNENDADVSAE